MAGQKLVITFHLPESISVNTGIWQASMVENLSGEKTGHVQQMQLHMKVHAFSFVSAWFLCLNLSFVGTGG